ncbi:hypothetical protein BD309DRAFT_854120, partial [Dichomitus squalens]|uniref:uncharacterized protein n=1 Tax=Dichomitus squalens (strain LYAD-421) TaxID=732165 RepID=UPI000441370C
GRSTARGSFLIWTHNLKCITFHETFRLTGAPTSETHDNAVALGADVQWEEAYNAVNAKDRVVVGDVSAGGTVGAASGWIIHSASSPTFGLRVDNVLQFAMISSNRPVACNCKHSGSNGTNFVANLFFALRGGGGGTYGVIISVTVPET